MAFIFISHSSVNKDFALKLSEDLQRLGHDVWLDAWEIEVGDSQTKKMDLGLEKADILVLVLTPDAVSSGWVDKEWRAAYWAEIETGLTKVLPVLLKRCKIPPLLRDKRYADFTESYPIGFFQLVSSISPVAITSYSKVSLGIDAPSIEARVSELLETIQAREITLSQCIAKAHKLAQEENLQNLMEWCSKELSGWNIPHDEQAPPYRLYQAFATAHMLNPNYIGWARNPSSVLTYMRSNTDDFRPIRAFWTHPVGTIEERAKEIDREKTMVLSHSTTLDSINPDAEDPSIQITIYCGPGIPGQILEGIRGELTRRLLQLLHRVD